MTLNVVLLTPKLEAFILVPICTNADKFQENVSNAFQGISMFGTHRLTDRQTHEQPKNIIPPATTLDEAQKRKLSD